MQYDTLLKTSQWFKKRKTILERDNHKCCNCGSDASLHVHHKQYHINKTTGMFIVPWKYENRYLITLCNKCHESGHQKYKVPTFNINHH